MPFGRKLLVGNLPWLSDKVRGNHGVGVWKGIIKGLDCFKKEVSFKVRSGIRVLFWHYTWVGDPFL